MGLKINFGCGSDKKAGYVNVDWNSVAEPDVNHDLNKFPYPFKENSSDLIEAFHVLEHLEHPFLAMKEFHRILNPGGRLHIKVPHFTRGFTHAEHKAGFDLTFPFYFNKNFSGSGYFGVDFELMATKFTWAAFPHLLVHFGFGRVKITLVKMASGILSFLANLSPGLCSRIWGFWVGGFEQIEFEFMAIKENQA